MRKLWRWIDLRFVGDHEAQYQSHLQPMICTRLGLASCVYFVLLMMSFLINYPTQARRDDLKFDWSFGDPRTLFFVAHVIGVSMLVITVAAVAVQVKVCSSKYWNWESIAMIYSASGALLVVLSNRELGWGQNPEAVWGAYPYGARSMVALMLDANVTAMCLFIPLRFTALAPTLSTAWVSYSITVVINGKFIVEVMEICVLGGLFVLAFIGSWTQERVMREKWLTGLHLKESKRLLEDKEVEIQDNHAMLHGLNTVAAALCDQIVKVSSDHRVTDPQNDLEEFFERPVQGLSFKELLHPDEHMRFDMLLGMLVKSSCPVCIQSIIQKPSGNCSVRLLLVDTKRQDSRFLVGIRKGEHLTEHLTKARTGVSPQPLGKDMVETVAPSTVRPISPSGKDSRVMHIESMSYSEDSFASVAMSKSMQLGNNSSVTFGPNSSLARNFSSISKKNQETQTAPAPSPAPAPVVASGNNVRQAWSGAGDAWADNSSSVSAVLPIRTASPSTKDAEVQTNGTTARPPATNDNRIREFFGKNRKSTRKHSSGHHSEDRQPMLSTFKATSSTSIEFHLARVCKFVNWRIAKDACCQWHASLEALGEAQVYLRGHTSCDYSSCGSEGGWQINCDWQCSQCLAVNVNEDSFCELCACEREHSPRQREDFTPVLPAF
eukprot:TRINITY_DN36824_c0_g1_i1.p1 TRINITY_DN36824_c0_g1~~TRINITY_DN36824_c0_g1_i1.p1  ORF type:complete len:663 (+),score=102.39 TRINITY_DN36824_c0_g1_i1:127-2115(+)